MVSFFQAFLPIFFMYSTPMRGTYHTHFTLLLLTIPITYGKGVQVMKILIMQFCPVSYYFIPLRSKYCPEHKTNELRGFSPQARRIPTAVNFGFLGWSRYFSIQVAPQLSSRGWVDPVPDPLLLRKSGIARNRTRDLWIRSQELWPLDHRGGP
jgi:hypothetical protein